MIHKVPCRFKIYFKIKSSSLDSQPNVWIKLVSYSFQKKKKNRTKENQKTPKT